MPTLEELSQEILELRTLINTYENRRIKSLQVQYDHAYNQLRSSFKKSERIQNIVRETLRELKLIDLFNDLTKYNGPANQ